MTIEPTNATWRAVKDHVSAQLAAGAIALEQRGMTELDTEFHRGRLSALREVLALADTPIEIVSSSTEY